jgi:hypothetical protein
MAHDWTHPKDMNFHVSVLLTFCGVLKFVKLAPVPSFPSKFSPQHHSEESLARIAQQ